jgi:hypothetical protein
LQQVTIADAWLTIPRVSANPARDRRPALFSALFALALYAITLRGTYVYDDRFMILSDPRLTPAKWSEFWTTDYFNGGPDNLYRPLVSMTYAIQVWLHGTAESRAWMFHAVNWLLHAGVCAAVAEMTRRLTRSSRTALFAGLLFAAHPVHVEAVANIVGRAELMCALGVVGAVTLLLRSPLTFGRVFRIWGCLVFALLSKEQGMLLPLLLLAVIPLRRGAPVATGAQQQNALPPSPPDSDETAARNSDPREEPGSSPPAPSLRLNVPAKSVTPLPYAQNETRRRQPRFSPPTLWLILLITWTTAAYLVIREQFLRLRFWWDRKFLDWTINPIVLSTGRDRALLPVVFLGRYAMLLIAPWRLTMDYGAGVIGPAVDLRDPFLYIGALAAAAWIIAAIAALLRRSAVVIFCLVGAALFYGVVGNLVSIIGIDLAERLMYLPSVFVCVLAALAIARLRPRAGAAVMIVLLALGSVRTFTYARQWNDPMALFQTALRHHPRAVRLQMLAAEELQRRGDLPQAQGMLAEARQEFPRYWKVWENSAAIALAAKDFTAAERFYRRALALNPSMQLSPVAKQLARHRAATAPAPPTTPAPATTPPPAATPAPATAPARPPATTPQRMPTSRAPQVPPG